ALKYFLAIDPPAPADQSSRFFCGVTDTSIFPSSFSFTKTLASIPQERMLTPVENASTPLAFSANFRENFSAAARTQADHTWSIVPLNSCTFDAADKFPTSSNATPRTGKTLLFFIGFPSKRLKTPMSEGPAFWFMGNSSGEAVSNCDSFTILPHSATTFSARIKNGFWKPSCRGPTKKEL